MSVITYDTEPCGRCGGSGQYSFNLQHGSTCFGCGGSGKALTKAAKHARKEISDWKDKHWSVAIQSVEPGMKVWAEPAYNAKHRWCEIVESKASTPVISNGVPVPYWSLYWMTRPSFGEPTRYGFSAAVGYRVRVRPVSFEPMYAFAGRLNGCTVSEAVKA